MEEEGHQGHEQEKQGPVRQHGVLRLYCNLSSPLARAGLVGYLGVLLLMSQRLPARIRLFHQQLLQSASYGNGSRSNWQLQSTAQLP